jgi:endonuclease YncB( thermonuclease family)
VTQINTALRHRVPWNGLFWLVIAALLLGAGGFTLGVHTKQAHIQLAGDAKIKNGDTVKVVAVLKRDQLLVDKDGHQGRLRLLGIRSFDAYVNEREIMAFGQRAVVFLERWAENRQVKVIFDDPIKDVHGRYLAYLELEGVDLGKRMVEEGVSMVYTEYPFERESDYLTAEWMARENRAGIWGGKKATRRIEALRRQWAAARKDRTGQSPPDYLIAEQP